MRRVIGKSILTAVLALSIFLHAGCGQTMSQPTSTPSQTDKTADAAPIQTDKTTDVMSSQDDKTTDAAPDTLNIVLVVSQLGDKSFNDSAWFGLQKFKEKHPAVSIKAIEIGSEPSKIEPTLIDVAPQYDVVVTGSYTYAEHVQTVASQFPNTRFIQFDSGLNFEDGGLSNALAIEYKANEASFLGGYLNAKLTKLDHPKLNPENIIGIILGIDAPVLNDFLVGYIDGALAADPDTKLAISYVGNFTDAAKAKELALSQYDLGADVIFGVAGGTNMGMFDAALEKNRLALGVDSDQAIILESTRPEISEILVSSVLKNVGESIFMALEKHMASELEWGTGIMVGIRENGVGLAENKYYESYVPEELREEMNEVYQKLYNGELTVRTAYGMPPDELTQIRNSVKP